MSAFSSIDKYQRQIEADTGLCVTRVQTPLQMASMLDMGLADLYRSVFSEPPYLEKFTLDEVSEIFQDFLKEDGHVFVVQDPAQAMKPVGFVVSLPLKVEFNVVALTGKKLNVEKTAYIAEEGVGSSVRRQGLSGRMKNLLLKTCGMDGFDKVLLRTSINNYRQISAVNKAGGVVLSNTFQDIARHRLDDSVSNDRNSFYLFDLKHKANVEQLDRVMIVPGAEGDCAYVTDRLDDAAKKAWDKGIRETYPGVTRVDFSGQEPAGKKIFDGRLYIARPA